MEYISAPANICSAGEAAPASAQGDLRLEIGTFLSRRFSAGRHVVCAPRETGLMKLIGDSLRLVPGGEKIANDGIYVMLPFDRDRVLVGARTQGCFI
jgi:hypothetical protein